MRRRVVERMLDMPQIDDIRRLWSEGYCISEIARRTGHDRKTVRKFLDEVDFSPEPPAGVVPGPSKLDPYKPTIDSILEADRHVWRKQRHTARKILAELRRAGYDGGYTLVQKYVHDRKLEMRGRAPEGFLDLEWSPGTAQADFGEADFDTADGRERMLFLVASFPHSSMSWFQVFRGCTSECVCQGLADVFRHIGGVPPVVVFDNATGAGRRVLDEVREAELFRRLRLHYGFEARFCNPDAGHEKGHVERKVAFVRSNVFVPVPRVGDLREYNESLLGVADGFGERGHWRRDGTWGELFESDRAALRPLPSRPFSCVTWLVRPCDKWGEVTVGTHSYGAGPELAGADVAVGLGAHEVTIVSQGTGELVARYRRRFGGGVTVDVDPVAELRLLGRRPGAWRESRVRSALPAGVVEYLDGLDRASLSRSVTMLSEVAGEEGIEAAGESMLELVRRGGDFSRSDLRVLSLRLLSGVSGPDPGPDLSEYDRAFLGKEAV